jgi:glycosyltransferase EpsE
MSKKPLVSAIGATYNGDYKLYLSVKSIFDQDYSNIEVILIDDCSTSIITKEVIQKLKDEFPAIQVIRNEKNEGLSYSLNRAIMISKGEFLARFDDDDLNIENRISLLVEELLLDSSIAVVGGRAYLYDGVNSYGVLRTPRIVENVDVLMSRSVIHPSVLIRKSSIELVGLYDNSDKTIRLEDIDLWFRMLNYGFKISNIAVPIIYYYESLSSVKKRSIRFRFRELKLKLKWIKKLRMSASLSILIIMKFILLILVPNQVYLIYRKKLRRN